MTLSPQIRSFPHDPLNSHLTSLINNKLFTLTKTYINLTGNPCTLPSFEQQLLFKP